MSLQPQPISAVPEETTRIARAAFPKGNRYPTLRHEIGTLYSDIDFAALYTTVQQMETSERVQLAMEVFCYRILKYVSAYLAALVDLVKLRRSFVNEFVKDWNGVG